MEKQQIRLILQERIHDKVIPILQFLQKPHKLKDILDELKLTYHTKNKRRYIDPLTALGYVEMTLKDSPTSKNQRYVITSKGKGLLNFII